MTHSYLEGVGALAIDCHDPGRLAGFWSALTGGKATDLDEDGNTTVTLPDGLNLDFLRVPEDKTVKNRLHLDLRSTDFEAAVQHAMDIGATKADDIYPRDDWQVLRDPEGNEFCILRPSGDS